MKKRRNIKIKFFGSREFPNGLNHNLPLELCVEECYRIFTLNKREEALTFLKSCTNPITNPSNISWAYGKSRGESMIKSWIKGEDFQNCKSYGKYKTIEVGIKKNQYNKNSIANRF